MSSRDALAAVGVDVDDATIERLDAYVERLITLGGKFNLIGTLDRDRVIHELIADSLAALPLLAERGVAVDIGTGAGLPGLPLAIALPSWRFVLVEPRQKRARFVASTARQLGLRHVHVVRGRLEDGAVVDLDGDSDLPARYDLAMSKAVFTPDVWPSRSAPLLKADGRTLIYLQGDVDEARAVLTPGDAERITGHRSYLVPQRGRRTVALLARSAP